MKQQLSVTAKAVKPVQWQSPVAQRGRGTAPGFKVWCLHWMSVSMLHRHVPMVGRTRSNKNLDFLLPISSNIIYISRWIILSEVILRSVWQQLSHLNYSSVAMSTRWVIFVMMTFSAVKSWVHCRAMKRKNRSDWSS